MFALAALAATPASAQRWTAWATGLRPGVYPVLAVAPSPRRDVYYSFLMSTPDGAGAVWRGRVDDPSRAFVRMPTFPLPTPAAGMAPANVMSMTTNRLGEPVVGLSAAGRSDNTDPMLMTWSESMGRWFAPPVTPAGNHCAHNLYGVERAPNGDIWAICQWHGAYVSTDDGRTFQYVDASARLRSSHPGYFPTRAAGTDDLGALYSLGFTADGTVVIGTETGGVVQSSDRGATWHPFDSDWANPRSALAGVTNLGNVYGLGVMPDGRFVMHGFRAADATPPPDATRLYAVDRAAGTVTRARGLPDYFLGGRTRFVALPSGEVFFHTNHDTVDAMGAPAFGGVLMTRNGVDWAPMNAGIDEAVHAVTGAWIDGNGRGAAGSLAVDGRDVYTATTTGRIYRLTLDAVTPTDAALADVSTDASDVVSVRDVAASTDVATPPDVAADIAPAPDVPAVTDVATATDAAPTTDAATATDSAPSRDTQPVTDAGAPADLPSPDAPVDALGDTAVDAPARAAAPSGCGCRAAPVPTHAPSVCALGVALLAIVRRRRGVAPCRSRRGTVPTGRPMVRATNHLVRDTNHLPTARGCP